MIKRRKLNMGKMLTLLILMSVFLVGCKEDVPANATVEDWCDYITAQKNAGTPITIRYELATPTTFTTQPTPVKSLEGINNLSVDCGEVTELKYFSETP